MRRSILSNTLLLGTFNPGKIEEIRFALARLPLEFKSLNDFPAIPSVQETGRTYLENAVLKAKFYSAESGLLTLADDSGLEVEALGGAPGVLSARYGGEDACDEGRVKLLLSKLKGVQNRRARFVCVIALADGDTIRTFQGECRGRVCVEPSGLNGFGYDPIFVPDGHEETFGELPSTLKDSISHRGRALAQLKTFLNEGSLDRLSNAT
jgi:XTP/dITP diphosphohydrolase